MRIKTRLLLNADTVIINFWLDLDGAYIQLWKNSLSILHQLIQKALICRRPSREKNQDLVIVCTFECINISKELTLLNKQFLIMACTYPEKFFNLKLYTFFFWHDLKH